MKNLLKTAVLSSLSFLATTVSVYSPVSRLEKVTSPEEPVESNIVGCLHVQLYQLYPGLSLYSQSSLSLPVMRHTINSADLDTVNSAVTVFPTNRGESFTKLTV